MHHPLSICCKTQPVAAYAAPTHRVLRLMQNADPWIEVDGGITPANAYKVLEPICTWSQLVTGHRTLTLRQAELPIERASAKKQLQTFASAS